MPKTWYGGQEVARENIAGFGLFIGFVGKMKNLE